MLKEDEALAAEIRGSPGRSSEDPVAAAQLELREATGCSPVLPPSANRKGFRVWRNPDWDAVIRLVESPESVNAVSPHAPSPLSGQWPNAGQMLPRGGIRAGWHASSGRRANTVVRDVHVDLQDGHFVDVDE